MHSFPIRSIPGLIRINVSLAVTLSAFASWVVASGKVTTEAILPVLAIFLLASGASALNQVQEKEQDAKMFRTRSRPIPSGKITSLQALILAGILLLSGFIVLAIESPLICFLFGLLNVAWYNGFYTWLKRKTAFAVVPGALTGVIPVMIGWTAGGGSVSDHTLLMLALFLFMWQIPHFWLLMLKYDGEYRSAGFPVMTETFSNSQFRNIIMAWFIGATGTSLLLVGYGFWKFLLPSLLIMCMNILLLVMVFGQLYYAKNLHYRLLFASMNGFLLLVLGLLVIERLLY
ncbi:MAG: UbiA family prenyltransferase [Bacteroidetes bacterium]|nr:UbiA family prenyltransferase [Bacteroidota bacterium]